MFKFIKIVLALVVLVVAGAFIYDKYCSLSRDCDEDGKCC
jgi:hypothetical protein